MSSAEPPVLGTIAWMDLTVADAGRVRDFYAAVAGWRPEPVAMGDYNDYVMIAPESGNPAAGICHARGMNADLPAQWLAYVLVADLDASLQRCVELDGAVLSAVKGGEGHGRYAVIQDPAGAVIALMQP